MTTEITPPTLGPDSLGDAKHKIKRVRGELKSLSGHMDSWESEDHTTVTIRFMRQWIARLDADLRKS